ncbi:TetR family transcriptional regulator [Rhodococcus sp. USK13]|uniref:TetR/AcrR family transcriptional regulator n=1 Tax=Rhodococcus sp. USK13 TaxID=2806442 RepID=UPI001BCE4332|nr:TetR family transcriptional regulator [Rhodococcus sp. USK13]
MTGRREQLLDAAIDVLGRKGARALTHRAVDESAGMPQGSTSNYFRTRGALLEGMVTRLAARDVDDWEKFADLRPDGMEALVEALAAFTLYAAGPDRIRSRARYALFAEASAVPALGEIIGSARAGLVEWGASMLDLAGSRNPAADAVVVTDYLDGVILHQLTVPDPDFDPTPGITAVLGVLT